MHLHDIFLLRTFVQTERKAAFPDLREMSCVTEYVHSKRGRTFSGPEKI